MLSASFLATSLVGTSLSNATLAPMAIHLYDRVEVAGAKRFGALGAEYLLYQKRPERPISAEDSHYFSRDIPIDMGGRRWQFRFEGLTYDYMTRTDRLLPWILLVGGLIVAALLASLIGSLSSARERAHTLANKITEDLRNSEAKLRKRSGSRRPDRSAAQPHFLQRPDESTGGVNKAWESFSYSTRRFHREDCFDLYRDDTALAPTYVRA